MMNRLSVLLSLPHNNNHNYPPSTQTQVAALQQHELQEVLPQLQALLEEAQAARAFARDHLLSDLRQMWEMPAMHLVPHRTRECVAARFGVVVERLLDTTHVNVVDVCIVLLLFLIAPPADLGKNCSQWLQEIQHLNAVKKELSNPAGRGHHVA